MRLEVLITTIVNNNTKCNLSKPQTNRKYHFLFNCVTLQILQLFWMTRQKQYILDTPLYTLIHNFCTRCILFYINFMPVFSIISNFFDLSTVYHLWVFPVLNNVNHYRSSCTLFVVCTKTRQFIPDKYGSQAIYKNVYGDINIGMKTYHIQSL